MHKSENAAGGVVLRAGQRAELEIHDLTSAGDGVARLEALVVFVPHAVPGDRVRVRLTRLAPRRAEAEIEQILEPSPDRIAPVCAHQPQCGGCPLMVLDTAAALRAKVHHLRETLRRIGRLDLAVTRSVPSPLPLGYRGRVKFAVAPRAAGAVLGYHARGAAGRLVPVERCHLAPPAVSEVAHAMLDELADRAAPNPARAAAPPWPTHLGVRVSLATGELLVALHTPEGHWPAAVDAARAITERFAAVRGVVRVLERRGRIAGVTCLAGEDHILERIGALTIQERATDFIQVNPAAAERMYAEIARCLVAPSAPRRLLDLFCGAGIAGLATTSDDVELVGIDSNPSSITDAQRIAAAAGRSRATFVVEDARAALQRVAAASETFDRIVVNPPRAGLGVDLAAVLARLAPEVVVLVSCHPAALARDLAGLAAVGFSVTDTVAVDMFPQTPHLEVVVRLTPTS